MAVKIFTITHVPFTPPDEPCYVPLQVGAALHDHLNFLCDDTGDNISAKNPLYSELTGMYWIWKNDSRTDYLGLCHYRRFFLNTNGALMNETEYLRILSQYDAIIARPTIGEYDYKTVYSRSHDVRNLELVEETLNRLYPGYLPVFHKVLSDTRCYVGNLFVTSRKHFNAYCEWLFSIFFDMEPLIDTNKYDDYHKRLFGFLSEQLLIVWIKYNNLSWYEADFGLSQEKAETIALKLKLKEHIAQGDFVSAYSLLDNTLQRRPDLLLELSDFQQELTKTEHILNICRIEQEAELPLFISVSNDLDVLIRHFDLLCTILRRISDGSASQNELNYLTECGVSSKALVYIMQNIPGTTSDPLTLLNQLAVLYSSAVPLTSLSCLEEALTLDEKNPTTLSNIAIILESMGHPEMAQEYWQLLSPSSLSKRIVVFTGFRFSILNYISNQYQTALKALGYTVYVFDIGKFEKSMEGLFLFYQKGLDAAIVFNNVGFQMHSRLGKSLWDEWKVPCFNIIVDHPVHYYDTLNDAPENGIVICSDRHHVDYVHRFYPTVRHCFFLPTAGECLHDWKELKPFDKRSIDVLFIGANKYIYDYPMSSFETYLMEKMIHHPQLRYETALEECLKEKQIQASGEKLKSMMEKYCVNSSNILSLYRINIIKSLLAAGIHVTLYGNLWEKTALTNYPNLHIMGQIEPSDGIALMNDAKIVLNQLAWFKAGASERIYEAMLQGAVALTDKSEYLLEQYTDQTDICFYSLEHLEKLPDTVRDILHNTSKTEEIRYNAYHKAVAQDTWLHRAKSLLEILDSLN